MWLCLYVQGHTAWGEDFCVMSDRSLEGLETRSCPTKVGGTHLQVPIVVVHKNSAAAFVHDLQFFHQPVKCHVQPGHFQIQKLLQPCVHSRLYIFCQVGPKTLWPWLHRERVRAPPGVFQGQFQVAWARQAGNAEGGEIRHWIIFLLREFSFCL